MNNSAYGKTMGNLRNRVNVQLINDEKKAQKFDTFKRFQIFDNELVGVEHVKKYLTLDKPIYVGLVILELIKLIMYNFHYNVTKKEYGDRAQLLFTDTDSLTYEVETEDIYQDISRHMDIYDTTDYPRDHFLFSESNKKKIGCFKDELHSKPIMEFIGLRPKIIQEKLGEFIILNAEPDCSLLPYATSLVHLLAFKMDLQVLGRTPCLLESGPTIFRKGFLESSDQTPNTYIQEFGNIEACCAINERLSFGVVANVDVLR
ncbi:unnamed protein product [Larinioides sclopetarius]|uniref:DNA-directed RNA polymerase n=1 Tax=Larinioides sclopetarius TaxID=280406 RepID=A0AAV1ZY75_9ARAC